jgi:hypothetical protein
LRISQVFLGVSFVNAFRECFFIRTISKNKISFFGINENLSDEERKERGKEMMKKNYKSEKEIAEAKGLKEFDYNGVKIYALNQKNADKKAKKQGLI